MVNVSGTRSNAIDFEVVSSALESMVTIQDNVLIRNKVAAFIITGGQDNIQAVAGQMPSTISVAGCWPGARASA